MSHSRAKMAVGWLKQFFLFMIFRCFFLFFLFLPGVEQFALNPIRVRHGCREGEGEGAEEEEDRGEER